MKKLITICLMMAMGFASNAQQLSNYYDAVSDGRSGFSYTITVRIQKKSDNTYTATLLQVTPDSKGYYDALSGKLYTCSQLGNVCQPNNFGRLSITIRYESNGQEQVAGVFSFTGVNETVPLGMAITKGAIDGKPSDASNFKLELMGGTLTVSHTTEISDKISKLNNVTSSPSSNNNSSTNLPQETSEQTTSSYTKQEITNQVVTGVAGLAGELLNDWNANIERKEKIRDAEYKAEISAKLEAKTNQFNTEFLPLMSKAKQGDENARMILFFASKGYEREYLVRDRMQWLEEASANGNMDALTVKAFSDGWENAIPKLEKLADRGNVDAMLSLCFWYNGKPDKSGQYSLPSGENPQKALEFYTRAAEKGSPNAMYALGMIYKYGNTTNDRYSKRIQVSYKDIIKLDEEIAFGWFAQSLQPNYVESIYSRGMDLGSHFDKNAYLEMAKIFREGRVVEKNKVRAKELEEQYRVYVNTQKFYYRK